MLVKVWLKGNKEHNSIGLRVVNYETTTFHCILFNIINVIFSNPFHKNVIDFIGIKCNLRLETTKSVNSVLMNSHLKTLNHIIIYSFAFDFDMRCFNLRKL